MSQYQHGVPINVVERVFLIDPLTEVATPTNATSAIFTVEDPDGTETTYEYGLAPNVTNPATGVYVLFLDPPADPGHYEYEFDSDDPDAHSEGDFDVLERGIDPHAQEFATPGPCTSWIDGDEVADCAGATLGVGSSTFLLDDVAVMASALLFELSGRQYRGTCERTHRPCRVTCGCWPGTQILGASSWGWSWQAAFGGSWANDRGGRCGCGSEDYVRLPGHPIRRILEVKIDGAVVPAGEYRLDGRRDLLRLDDPGPPVVRRTWPSCQNISLPDSEPGTFSIRYLYGMDPPVSGRMAAAQLAVELYKACPGSTGECRLPNKVTRIVRQGLTIEKLVPLADLLKEGATGLQLVDSFIAGANPRGIRRRPAVWSPDGPQMGRRTG